MKNSYKIIITSIALIGLFSLHFFAILSLANSTLIHSLGTETPQVVCTVKQIAVVQLDGWHVLGPLEKCYGEYDESQDLIACTKYIPYRTPVDFKVTVRICKTDTELIGGSSVK